MGPRSAAWFKAAAWTCTGWPAHLPISTLWDALLQVYRGGWNGNIVAVKVIEYQEEVDSKGEPVGVVAHARNGIFEAVVSQHTHTHTALRGNTCTPPHLHSP